MTVKLWNYRPGYFLSKGLNNSCFSLTFSHILSNLAFADDNFFVNRKKVSRLLEAMIPLKLRWFCMADITVSEDDELLWLARQAGCHAIFIGPGEPISLSPKESIVGLICECRNQQGIKRRHHYGGNSRKHLSTWRLLL
jgi:hypothetical protein